VNQFWPVLYKGGVVPEPFDYHDDKRVIEFGIGLTDLVKRPTKTTAELTREDFAEGRIVLSQRLGEYTPHVIAFNGKLAFEQFAQRKCKFGLQKETNTQDPHGNSERVRHFRKLAQLVSRTETERASKGN
jgi:TDG/mug DNA glycosylase family protein